MITFSSLTFLFRFLPVLLLVYFVTPQKYRFLIVFLGSVIFYAAGEPVYFILLLLLSVFNWWVGRSVPGNRKRLRTAVFVNVLVLTVFKVLQLLGVSYPAWIEQTGALSGQILLPMGLSFYLFKMISYLGDRYRGELKENPGFLPAMNYFILFPQIAQGPIARYHELYPEGREVRPTAKRLESGLVFLVLGLSAKLLLADRVGILWNEISKIGYESISTPLAWLGAFAYSFQLYFDFWGYSLMAAGVGMMLGYPFIVNFRHPYAAHGVADFYRRWHITLGAFFRDYVYIPLGGSRGGRAKTVRNLLIVWLLTGIWHGGTLNFVLWGLTLFAIIVWEKFVVRGLLERFPLLSHLHVLVLIPVTWVIFALPDLRELGVYLGRLFPLAGNWQGVNEGDFERLLVQFLPLLAACALLCFPSTYELIVQNRKKWYVLLPLTALFWVCVFFSASSASNPFMYLNF